MIQSFQNASLNNCYVVGVLICCHKYFSNYVLKSQQFKLTIYTGPPLNNYRSEQELSAIIRIMPTFPPIENDVVFLNLNVYLLHV
jgi:hypothetical protein